MKNPQTKPADYVFAQCCKRLVLSMHALPNHLRNGDVQFWHRPDNCPTGRNR